MSFALRQSRYRGPAAAVNPPPSGPTWLLGLSLLTWTQVGSNTIQDVNPAQDASINPSGGGTNNAPWTVSNNGAISNTLPDMTNEWSGGVWDEANKRWWVTGGGHGGYKGNEEYSALMSANSPAWIRRGYPSGSIQMPNASGPNANGLNGSVQADQRPHQVHTYNLPCIDGSGNIVILPSGFQWQGNATSNGYLFSNSLDDWDTSTPFVTPDTNGQACCGCYDPVSGKIFAFINDKVVSYDPVTRVRTACFNTNGNWTGYYCHMIYDSLRQLMVVFAGAAGSKAGPFATCAVGYFDPASPTAFTITTQSAGDFNWGTRGICYDSTGDRYLVWDEASNNLITITPPATSPGTNTWVHSTLTCSGTLSAAATAGTWGRLVYMHAYECVGLLNKTTEKPYLLKLR